MTIESIKKSHQSLRIKCSVNSKIYTFTFEDFRLIIDDEMDKECQLSWGTNYDRHENTSLHIEEGQAQGSKIVFMVAHPNHYWYILTCNPWRFAPIIPEEHLGITYNAFIKLMRIK